MLNTTRYNSSSKRRKVNWLCVGIIVTILCLIIAAGTSVAEEEASKYRANEDKTVFSISLDTSSVDGVKEILDQLQDSDAFNGVTGFVSKVSDVSPELILMGSNSGDVEKALKLFQTVLTESAKQKHIIVISATLKELSDSDIKDIGMNLEPFAQFGLEREYLRNILSTHTMPGYMSNSAKGTAVIGLNAYLHLINIISKGKTLVSSEIYTPAGVKGILTNVQTMPISAGDDERGNSSNDSKDLETSIDVIPTIIKYDQTKPEESSLKLDVTVKFTVVIGITADTGGFSAPEYVVKEFTSRRILKANGQNVIFGTFLTDTNIKSKSGIPLLSKLPLLKHLFSHETSHKSRNTAVLMMSARILPVE